MCDSFLFNLKPIYKLVNDLKPRKIEKFQIGFQTGGLFMRDIYFNVI